ncbi:MAG: hypothetical protein WCA07_14505 [Gloeobacterales cyanobacterium]
MSRPRLDVDDEYQLTGDEDYDEPALSTEQYTTNEDGGGQVHAVSADIDHDGEADAFEYTQRRHDGSSVRAMSVTDENGSVYNRGVEMDRSGRVKSMYEQEFDEEGRQTSGRYDDDGDGKIDRELRDLDGDGELDDVRVNNRRGNASQFDFEAKGEWSVDADGDGDADWRSSLNAQRSGLDHNVDVLQDGDVVARDQSHMDRAGSSRDIRIDTDRDDIFDERDVTHADTSGHLTYAERDLAEGTDVIDRKIDRDGDGTVDIWQNDYDRDGDMDDIRF